MKALPKSALFLPFAYVSNAPGTLIVQRLIGDVEALSAKTSAALLADVREPVS
jgi:hypothetical protein